MCSPICPCPGAHCTSFLQTKHFCKAPTSSSHKNLILGFLPKAKQRYGGSKWARLSAPIQGPTVSVSCK